MAKIQVTTALNPELYFKLQAYAAVNPDRSVSATVANAVELFLAMEAEFPAEMTEAEEPEVHEPESWQRFDLHTREDAKIAGEVSTNDNRDLGYPNESAHWRVLYADHAEMLRRTGGSHTGCSGVKVTVILDGNEVLKFA